MIGARVTDMRDVETVDEDLAVLVTLRCMLRDHGIRPSARAMDDLLDERLTLMPGAAESSTVQFSSNGGR